MTKTPIEYFFGITSMSDESNIVFDVSLIKDSSGTLAEHQPLGEVGFRTTPRKGEGVILGMFSNAPGYYTVEHVIHTPQSDFTAGTLMVSKDISLSQAISCEVSSQINRGNVT